MSIAYFVLYQTAKCKESIIFNSDQSVECAFEEAKQQIMFDESCNYDELLILDFKKV